MPLLDPVVAEMIIAGITIWYGIAGEPHFVSRSTILLNALTTFVILFSLNISSGLAFLLILYTFFGLGLRLVRGKQYLKFLYGSKVFGSFALSMGFVEFMKIENVSGWIVFWWIVFVLCTLGIAILYYNIPDWIARMRDEW